MVRKEFVQFFFFLTAACLLLIAGCYLLLLEVRSTRISTVNCVPATSCSSSFVFLLFHPPLLLEFFFPSSTSDFVSILQLFLSFLTHRQSFFYLNNPRPRYATCLTLRNAWRLTFPPLCLAFKSCVSSRVSCLVAPSVCWTETFGLARRLTLRTLLCID